MVVRGGGVAVGALLVLGAAGCGPRAGRMLEPPTIDEGRGLETMSVTGVGESLTLRFGWRDGLEGRCRSVRRSIDDGAVTAEDTITSGVHVQHTSDAVRITTDHQDEEGASPTRVTVIVESDGRYRRAEGIEAMIAAMPGDLDSREAAVTAALVRQRLARIWKLRVGAWAGRELPLGATYSATAPEQVLGDTVRMRIAIQADGRIPCRVGDVEPRCVRLRFRSQPEDPAPLALVPALLTALLPDAGLEAGTVVATTASVITSAVVVTEPETLLPHHFALRRRLLLAGSSPERPMLVRERHEEMTQSCAWR